MCMMYRMAHSYDLTKKALDYIEQGKSKVEASQIFGVTVQTLKVCPFSLLVLCTRRDFITYQ